MSTRTSKMVLSRSASGSRWREVAGICLLALGAFLGLSLLSFQVGDGSLTGPMGRAMARAACAAFGIGAHLATLGLVWAAVRLLGARPAAIGIADGAFALLGLVSLTVLAHLVSGAYRLDGYTAGGFLGELFGEILRSGVSTTGAALLGIAGLLAALVATTPLEMAHLCRFAVACGRLAFAGIRSAGALAWQFAREVALAMLPGSEEDDEGVTEGVVRPGDEKPERRTRKAKQGDATPLAIVDGEDGDTVRVGEPAEVILLSPKSKKERKRIQGGTPEEAAPRETVPSDATAPSDAPTFLPGQGPASSASSIRAEPVIVESSFHKARKKDMSEMEKEVDENRPDFIPLGDGKYRLPPMSLLRYDDTSVNVDCDAMKELAARLVNALGTYGIRGEVTAIRPGPVVTMYELAPAPGTRVSRIANLADDLTMALEAESVRIVAPIPGKAAVGIEVPNKQRETVFLKEILADDVFQKAKSKLQIALGKDSEGRPVAVDLAKMPHLLVAGTTGAGKSVGLNAMIASLLYSSTPEEVRLIMIDPKMLELSVYEGIPHLLLPVVTDPKMANRALKWAVDEMERRYQLMAEAGVRDILSYNRKCEGKGAAKEAEPAPVAKTAVDSHAEAVPVETPEQADISGAAVQLSLVKPTKPQKKLPFIVVIIDEFADLMMQAAKEVEHSVTRIAQKARACGIHLIIATQRPTTEVITGLIKSNFPSRVAFKVTNKINSIAILEQSGAEALLGQGDMLFSDRGMALRRVHGCLVLEDEIGSLVEFLKKQAKPVYDMDILKPREEEEGSDAGDGEDDLSDDMYDRAVALVAETQQASISMIQRRLRVGYNRAARMVERMEREGVVGPPDGTNRREVLIRDAS
ncbi:MAG: DNA translocase FtsK 4TM domain-containing protein [Deltaproteobacteria bacterium]|nr:DNA translocase FtsK 4TM domain-containing protein [Deltaproteobacteria bacterium]